MTPEDALARGAGLDVRQHSPDGLLVCPACRAALERSPSAYACGRCGRRFPIVLGIPDLRLEPDPWLGIPEDRQKAERIAERARSLPFTELVRFYWSITPATPDALARRYVQHALAGEMRGERCRDELRVPSPARLLDLGSGTGGLLVAAARRGDRATGVDVALRWLVVARRRLQDAGVEAELVCANAERVPFRDGGFDAVTGLGLLEHARDPGAVVREARRVLRPGGRALFTTVNRWAPTPEPHVGLWGVGYLPRRLGIAYARWRRGVPYDRINPLGRRALSRLFERARFGDVAIEAEAIAAPEAGGPPALWLPLVRLYERARRGPLPLRWPLASIAPVLRVQAERSSEM